METFNIPLNKVDLKLLVCGLYTISENDRFFKRIKFKKEKFSLDKQDLHEFKILLNSPPLRKFAFKLLKPLLNKNNSLSSIKDNQLIQDESFGPGFHYWSNTLKGPGRHCFEATPTSDEAADLNLASDLVTLSNELIQTTMRSEE